ncbi:EYxxD motif small membrane protein [Bacillus sp. JJ1122]|uniref:EYxxD motif small membrane protein n=1 Tax=Bacillus sp. JJ1122 TaxID=3122951 RepID=UPI0030003E73
MVTEKDKSPQTWGLHKGDDTMFWEYVTDMSFVWIAIVGSIIALLLVYTRGVNKRRAR